jgi:hypothetical protein
MIEAKSVPKGAVGGAGTEDADVMVIAVRIRRSPTLGAAEIVLDPGTVTPWLTAQLVER